MTRPAPRFTTRPDRLRRAGRDPFVQRLAILAAAGIVITPVALLIGRSEGHEVVKAGNLPGAAVGVVPGSATTPTTPAPQPLEPVVGTVPPTITPSGTLPPTVAPSTTQADRSTARAASNSDESSSQASGSSSSSRSSRSSSSGSGSSGSSGSGSGSSGSGSGSSRSSTSSTSPPHTVATTQAPRPTVPPTTAPVHRQWDVAVVVQIIRNVWPDDLEAHALYIANRESHFDPYAQNYCCTGLFQIYGSVHEKLINALGYSVSQLTDPLVNSIVAYAIYQRDGWAPWGG